MTTQLRRVMKMVAATAFVAVPHIVFAATLNTHGFPDPLNTDVPGLVNRLILASLTLAGSIFFVMFLWGGFEYMTAGGDGQKVKKSRTLLLNAVIGLLIIAASYSIVMKIANMISAAQTPVTSATTAPTTGQ